MAPGKEDISSRGGRIRSALPPYVVTLNWIHGDPGEVAIDSRNDTRGSEGRMAGDPALRSELPSALAVRGEGAPPPHTAGGASCDQTCAWPNSNGREDVVKKRRLPPPSSLSPVRQSRPSEEGRADGGEEREGNSLDRLSASELY